MELWFQPLAEGKFRLFGDDGNDFESVEEAWTEAQAAADLGLPWAGAVFRLVDVDGADHTDDCALGLSRNLCCDCGVELVIVGERRFFPAEAGLRRLLVEAVGVGRRRPRTERWRVMALSYPRQAGVKLERVAPFLAALAGRSVRYQELAMVARTAASVGASYGPEFLARSKEQGLRAAASDEDREAWLFGFDWKEA